VEGAQVEVGTEARLGFAAQREDLFVAEQIGPRLESMSIGRSIGSSGWILAASDR
jgi:hypothetical protein